MRTLIRCAVAGASVAAALPAAAHVIAGDRVFPVTLNFDDPGVGDEISIPSFDYSRGGSAGGGVGPSHETDLGFEFDKTITSDTALIWNNGYDVRQANGAKTQSGWENIVITGKWQAYTNGPHETVVSLGIQRELGGTGTNHLNGDMYGSTAPTVYIGKGLGDVPWEGARPFAVTGEVSYTVADREFKQFSVYNSNTGMISTLTNNGSPNAWSGGVSVQYSIPYLQAQVKDIGLRGIAANLIPVVEFTYASPASANTGTQVTWQAAPGVIWLGRFGEVGLEATIPLNRATGTTVGVVGMIHLFFDDLLPGSLGKHLL